MSVIANYLRVSIEHLETWGDTWDMIDGIRSGQIAGAECCELDKDYERIAWILSPAKREETRRTNLFLKNGTPPNYSGIQPEPVLIAIEGRVPDAERNPNIDCGMGPGCVFPPSKVAEFSKVLNKIDLTQFKELFSAELMAEQMDDPDIVGMGERIVDVIYWPVFKRLREFFTRAAAENQHLIVVYS